MKAQKLTASDLEYIRERHEAQRKYARRLAALDPKTLSWGRRLERAFFMREHGIEEPLREDPETA